MPSGLIFVGSAGGTNPSSKTITISNPSPNALSYLTTAFANTSSSGASNVPVWFSATPPSGTVSANQPGTVSIQPNLTGLAAGVYTGDLTVTLTTTTSVMPQTLHVEVLLLVLPAGISLPGQVTSKIAHPQAAGACTPTQLLPVFTLLGTGFSATAGWPTAIEVTVIDDCGTPLNTGSVTLTFSSGDPALALASIGGGHWTGTWNATHSTSNVTIGAQAQETQPGALREGADRRNASDQHGNADCFDRRGCQRGQLHRESASGARRLHCHLRKQSQPERQHVEPVAVQQSARRYVRGSGGRTASAADRELRPD